MTERKFQDIAKEIIKKSIRSAICIDDMFEQPYMEEKDITRINEVLSNREKTATTVDKVLPTKLYRSFREVGECDLDIYNFTSYEDSWHPEYMLNNKDLIVIDWELEGIGKFDSTIKILKQAITSNQYSTVPFIIIYTRLPIADFNQIIYEIISSFNPLKDEIDTKSNEFASNFLAVFEDFFEDKDQQDEDDIIIWLENSKNTLFEYWNSTGDSKEESKNRIYDEIHKEFNIKKETRVDRKLKSTLKNTFNCDEERGLEQLFYLSCDSKNDYDYDIDRIKSTDLGIKINQSLITIFSKEKRETGEGVRPEDVFNTFSDLICKDPHNFLTLLSIEMKDKLRDDLYKIRNNISSLDERAFFHHLNNYKKRSQNYKNEFFDFLLKCWTNEIESYNYNNLPLVFEALEEYAQKRKYEEIKGDEIIKEIGDLGHKLSTVNIRRRLTDSPTLRFGDILRIKRPYRGLTDEYLICITPACVCGDPDKIKNNFYFIKSDSAKPFTNSTAKKLETGYYSLIKINKELLVIDWGVCKPFTLHISNNNLNDINSFYCSQAISLEYITTSKENFTQRIANKSFSYGTSIGIDLPNTKKIT